MKKLIKLSGIFLAICVVMMCIFCVSSYAKSNHDIVDFNGEMLPMQASLKSETGGFGTYKTETVSGVYRDYYNFGVVRTKDYSASDELIQHTQYRNFADKLYFSFDLRYTTDAKGSLNFALRHNGDNTDSYGTLPIINFNPATYKTTYLSSYGVSADEVLEVNKWYTFNIIFNIPEDTITIYRDGTLVATAHNTKTYNEKLKLFNYEESMPRFQAFVSSGTVGSKVSFDIDNVELIEDASLNDNCFVTGRNLLTDIKGKIYEAEYIRDGKFISKAQIINKSKTQKIKATLAVGRYSATGEMKAFFKSYTYEIEAGKSVDAQLEFSIKDMADGEYIRVFIVDDFNNLSPIATYSEFPKSLLNPFGAEIVDAVYEKHPNYGHPRLLMDKEKLEFLADACYSQEPYKTWYSRIKSKADGIINQSFAVYDDLDELRLSSAGEVGDNLTTLSFVYAIENEAGKKAEKYVKRIVDEMVNVSVENPEWADWNPQHFLDTSDILLGYAYAYDWCYDYFNRPENTGEKEMMLNTLKKYGLNEANLAYKQISNSWWTSTNSNWNMVCNAGIAVASLAVCDEDEFKEISPYLLEQGLKSVRKCFAEFAPDGAWFEGTDYWKYTINLMSIYFAGLQTATGTDFDYMKLPGISTTGMFPIAMTGRAGAFNLNDSYEEGSSIPELWYFANQFNNTTLAKYRYYQISKLGMSTSYKDILWYNEDLLGEDKNDINSLLAGMKTDSKYSGVEIATFRDAYFDAGKYFAGFHGGQNGINHGHIDAGSFIYDAKVEGGADTRWAIDLGRENYNLYNMFGGSDLEEKSRWAYYRNRGEGHNTIVINPDKYADQDINKTATITDFKSANDYGYAVVDMNPVHKGYTSSAYRGIYFDKANGSLMVRDEIVFENPENNLYWFMHTKAEIEIANDGKSAILTQNSQRLWVGIIDGGQTFSIMDAVPLNTSPNPDEWEENKANDGSSINPQRQNENAGIRKLVINDSAAGGKWNLTVYMVLLEDGQSAPTDIPENIELSSWK